MNQGIAFARTLRALETDDFRGSKFGLLIAALLLGAWTWWIFAARVPQYESTTNVRIEHGLAIAYFASTSDIRPGQAALLNFSGTIISARVQSVASDHAALVLTPNPQSPVPASSSASADIEVSRVSPASIALQALGRHAR